MDTGFYRPVKAIFFNGLDFVLRLSGAQGSLLGGLWGHCAVPEVKPRLATCKKINF